MTAGSWLVKPPRATTPLPPHWTLRPHAMQLQAANPRHAHLVGRDNVMAGVVWAKMAMLAKGAEIASRRFWS